LEVKCSGKALRDNSTFSAIYRESCRRGISPRELYSSLSPEDLYLLKVADISLWSDEIEMLAKLRADVYAVAVGKSVRWEKFLPYRFQESATIANVPTESSLKQITRSLGIMFDGFVKRLTSGKLHS
jgi:hypothetical protein